MMVPVDDDEDDFIVQTVEDTGTPDTQQRDASWSLKKLGRLVFSSNHKPAVEEPEPEPTLPAGFSATLNAEEEETYPAEVRTPVASDQLYSAMSCHKTRRESRHKAAWRPGGPLCGTHKYLVFSIWCFGPTRESRDDLARSLAGRTAGTAGHRARVTRGVKRALPYVTLRPPMNHVGEVSRFAVVFNGCESRKILRANFMKGRGERGLHLAREMRYFHVVCGRRERGKEPCLRTHLLSSLCKRLTVPEIFSHVRPSGLGTIRQHTQLLPPGFLFGGGDGLSVVGMYMPFVDSDGRVFGDNERPAR